MESRDSDILQGVLAAADALEDWGSNHLSEETSKTLLAVAKDLRRNAHLIGLKAAQHIMSMEAP